MKRIIFLRHLSYIWDNGKHLIDHKDYRALQALGQNLNIDAIIHSNRTCDHISALALNQGCYSKVLVRDERLMSTHFLKPKIFLEGVHQNADNNGFDTIAIIAGCEPLCLLGCPPLEHGAFYIKHLHPCSDCLTSGSIEDFRNILPDVTYFAKEAVAYLY